MSLKAITSGSPVGSAHIRALDGIRALAFLFIFCFHLQLSAPLTYAGNSSAVTRGVVSIWNMITMRLPLGVDIFFVLSGFLITSILLKARGTTNFFRVFYARRCLRIFPVYYAAVLITFLAGSYPFRTQIWFWINSSNVISCINPSVVLPLTHFWTLAVEEHFYLIWPLLVYCLCNRTLVAICLFVPPLQYGLRMLPFVLQMDHRYSNFSNRLTPFHSEGLFVGALLAVAMTSRFLRPEHLQRVRIVALACLVWFIFLFTPLGTSGLWLLHMMPAATSALTAAVIAVVLLNPGGWLSRCLSIRPLTVIGRYSFCMYVVHQPLLFHIAQLAPASFGHHRWGWPLIGLEMFLLTFVISALSWRFFEEPILNLKRFFMYRTVAFRSAS